jgi:ribosome biogenesis protein Nip4
MKVISDFISKFGTRMTLNQNMIVGKNGKYFLLNKNLRLLITKDFFYAGTYLGKMKDGAFLPSLNLLAMIVHSDANKITVDNKTEWLFICGRDVFKKGIKNISRPARKGDYTLVLNERGDCLGFGVVRSTVGKEDRSKVIVRNIADVGDFLRRERQTIRR